MIPTASMMRERIGSFPRVSGDDPTVPSVSVLMVLFSPRERG